jgi:hypothetical protein
MSTRCNIHFCYGDEVVANIYRHSDGYPSGVLPDLDVFFARIMLDTRDHRFGDPSYLAAKFVVWQADQSRNIATKWGGKAGEMLDFLGVGIVLEDAGDGEYVYEVVSARGDDLPSVRWRGAGSEAWHVGLPEPDEDEDD